MIHTILNEPTTLLPLSLYIHIPWCVRKCPYCDFNSHAVKDSLPEQLYVAALLQQLESHLPLLQHRPLISLFFGGGTPSLFSAQAIETILNGVAKHLTLADKIEITLEANPGTIDQAHFKGYYRAGVNRISIGVQSFQNDKLQILGRIHQAEHALRAVEAVTTAGITDYNLDLMYGLPQQTLADALSDLNTAISCQPTHLSWYQLTIEPNTVFYKQPPTLPVDDSIWEMQEAGQALLASQSYQQYEVSAYAQPQRECQHNRNYWEFGDYLGIGAGAHSKLTQADGRVLRFSQVKQPNDYLLAAKRQDKNLSVVATPELIFEFMLNALRLTKGVPRKLFSERTGLPLSVLNDKVQQAIQRGLLVNDDQLLCPTEIGKRFLNDLVEMFL